jgi:hypothetical protein
VFDQKNRHPFFDKRAKEFLDLATSLPVHPGHGFVEQQEAGFQGQRAGNFQPSSLSVRETSGGGIPSAVNPYPCQACHGLTPAPPFLTHCRGQVEQARQKIPLAPEVLSGNDVLQAGHSREKPDVLKSPRNSHGGNTVCRQHVNRLSGEQHAPGIGFGETAQYIYEGGLAGAVRTDEPMDRSGRDGKRNTRERTYAPERSSYIFDLKQHGHIRVSDAQKTSAQRSRNR